MNNVQNGKAFTCYFCHKVIENDTEYGHVSSCGAVLEPCAHKCGSYIPRSMQARHVKECRNKLSKSMSKLSVEEHQEDPRNLQKYSNTIERTRPKQMNYQLPFTYIPELHSMPIKLLNLEQVFQQLHQNVIILKSKHQDMLQTQHTAKLQLQLYVEKMQYQNQIINEWKRNVELQYDNLKQELNQLNKFKDEYGTRIINLDQSLILFQSLSNDIQKLQQQFHKEQVESRELHNDLQETLNEFKDYFTQESAVVAALWNDQKTSIDNMSEKVGTIQSTLNDNKNKYTSWVFDLRTVSQITAETSDKLCIQERTVCELTAEVQQLKLDLQALHESAPSQTYHLSNTPGHLLWRITDFSSKLETARESNTVLKSPILYTHQYGYKIRLLLYLNGLKKWKGRHMLACIHVLKGEYDLLLKWPCYISGNITLRELHNITNENNYLKYITAKRYKGDEENEEPQEASKQYIFVPHSVLTKQNYIKEDTLFMELKIDSIQYVNNK